MSILKRRKDRLPIDKKEKIDFSRGDLRESLHFYCEFTIKNEKNIQNNLNKIENYREKVEKSIERELV